MGFVVNMGAGLMAFIVNMGGAYGVYCEYGWGLWGLL